MNKQCKEYVEWDDDYKKLTNITDVLGINPDGYLVRFPFYIVAERDAHIVFTETDNPDWFTDNVYEIGKFMLTENFKRLCYHKIQQGIYFSVWRVGK